MSIYFFTACFLCILYCGLYGGYRASERNIPEAISVWVMTALAAGAAAALMVIK